MKLSCACRRFESQLHAEVISGRIGKVLLDAEVAPS